MKGVCCYLRAFWICVISFDQELQQQLIIETRNLKKTRNFYQKLIQQERKNKGLMAFLWHCVCVYLKKNPVDLQQWFLKQCMYSKGSECKPMLSKLKFQFEELKSKVVFLDCVKKYLEVLRNLYDSLLFIILCLITSIYWYNSCIFPDSECGPVGVRGFITAFSGCLWLCLSGSPILPGSVCSVLWHQQREEHSASWLSPGPHGLPLCQVLLLRI